MATNAIYRGSPDYTRKATMYNEADLYKQSREIGLERVNPPSAKYIGVTLN